MCVQKGTGGSQLRRHAVTQQYIWLRPLSFPCCTAANVSLRGWEDPCVIRVEYCTQMGMRGCGS